MEKSVPEVVEICPNLAEIHHRWNSYDLLHNLGRVAESGAISTELREFGRNPAIEGPLSTEFVQSSATFVASSTDLGQAWPVIDPNRPDFDRFGATPTDRFRPIWPNLVRFRPNLFGCSPVSATFGLESAKFGTTSVEIGPNSTKLGAHSANLGRVEQRSIHFAFTLRVSRQSANR